MNKIAYLFVFFVFIANITLVQAITNERLNKLTKSLQNNVSEYFTCIRGKKDCTLSRRKIILTTTAIILGIITIGGSITLYGRKKHKPISKPESPVVPLISSTTKKTTELESKVDFSKLSPEEQKNYENELKKELEQELKKTKKLLRDLKNISGELNPDLNQRIDKILKEKKD